MRVFILLVLFLPVYADSQTYSGVISDKVVTTFFRWKLANDSIEGKMFINKRVIPVDAAIFHIPDSLKGDFRYSSTYLFKKENKLDSLFTEEDKAFMLMQAREANNTEWKLKFRKIVLEKSSSLHPDHTTWSFSLPFFSFDRKKVVIAEAFYCGLVCGGGAYYIYSRNEDGSWTFIKKVNEWAE